MSFKVKFADVKAELKSKGFITCVKESVVLSHHEPHDIAAGFAIGMMFSFFPSIGIGMLISLFLAWKRGWNFLATYLGTLLMNPFTASFWYFLEYQIGEGIIGNGMGFVENITQKNFFSVAKEVYLGALVIAIVLGPIAYFLLYGLSAKYRELKKKGKIPLQIPTLIKK